MKNSLNQNNSEMDDDKGFENDLIGMDSNETELNPEFVAEVIENEEKSNPSIVDDLDELFA